MERLLSFSMLGIEFILSFSCVNMPTQNILRCVCWLKRSDNHDMGLESLFFFFFFVSVLPSVILILFNRCVGWLRFFFSFPVISIRCVARTQNRWLSALFTAVNYKKTEGTTVKQQKEKKRLEIIGRVGCF